jgi:hypothetical protein
VRQAPPQRGPRIVRDIPEHGAEVIAALRTPGDCEIGEQSPRLFGPWQLHPCGVLLHSELAQHGNTQQLFDFHDPGTLLCPFAGGGEFQRQNLTFLR